jgi:hypothetical protein
MNSYRCGTVAAALFIEYLLIIYHQLLAISIKSIFTCLTLISNALIEIRKIRQIVLSLTRIRLCKCMGEYPIGGNSEPISGDREQLNPRQFIN